MKRGDGTLVWLEKSQQWAWRGRVTIDGERVRKQYALETSVRSVAEAKARRLLEATTPAKPTAIETFRDAAERIVLEQRDEGIVNWAKRRSRFRRWAYDVCGHVQVTLITADHVRDALSVPLKAGMSKQTILHFRNDFSTVLGALWRADLVKENVVAKVKLPKSAAVDHRKRVVPTDGELMQLISCPLVRPELQTAVMLARTIGGQRTSDLFAADWSLIDLQNWQTFDVSRSKTGAYDTHAIPDVTAPILEAWWHACGRPERGPIFPVNRGPRQGERRKAGSFSWAGELREAFWLADVGRPAPGSPSARERRLKPSTGLSRGDCMLQSDTPRSKHTGFHAIRAAYITATHRVALDPAMQMRLAAHTTWGVHQGYIDAGQVLSIPAEALPRFEMPENVTARVRMLNSSAASTRNMATTDGAGEIG